MKKWLYFSLIAALPFSLYASDKKEKKKDDKESGYAYVYQKQVEGNTTKSHWSIKKNGHGYEMSGNSPAGKTCIKSDKDLYTLDFDVTTASGVKCTMKKEHGMLYASRHSSDGDTHKSYKALKSIPWIQELDFSFRPFILSDKKSFKFQIINPKNLSIHTLIATKQGTEEMELHGTKYTAMRVKMTLTGLQKMFWSSQVWYDTKTGDLIKYIANEGPGTPVSTITLMSRKKL